jgi:hypothetical protein
MNAPRNRLDCGGRQCAAAIAKPRASYAALTAEVAAGEMTPGEAAELSKMIEAYISPLRAECL